MAKRLTDSEKWRDPWFLELTTKQKLFYIWLLDSCNHAGIWKANFRLACFEIGENYTESECLNFLSERVEILPGGYWFIKKFVFWQYGGVNQDSIGLSVAKVFDLHNISYTVNPKKQGATKPLPSPSEGAKVKVINKDKDIVKEEKGVIGGKENQFPTDVNISQLTKADILTTQEFLKLTAKTDWSENELSEYFEAFKIQNFTGKKFYEDHSAIITHFRNWMKSQKKSNINGTTKTGKSAAIIAALKELK